MDRIASHAGVRVVPREADCACGDCARREGGGHQGKRGVGFSRRQTDLQPLLPAAPKGLPPARTSLAARGNARCNLVPTGAAALPRQGGPVGRRVEEQQTDQNHYGSTPRVCHCSSSHPPPLRLCFAAARSEPEVSVSGAVRSERRCKGCAPDENYRRSSKELTPTGRGQYRELGRRASPIDVMRSIPFRRVAFD